MRHELYRVTDLPVLLNRTFADPASAKASATSWLASFPVREGAPSLTILVMLVLLSGLGD